MPNRDLLLYSGKQSDRMFRFDIDINDIGLE